MSTIFTSRVEVRGAEPIERIRDSKRRALILAHLYQPAEVQDVADRVGDSLELARFAVTTDAEVIVLAGVRFMAESAKLLNPERTVLLPAEGAGCPMADMIDDQELRVLKAQHPGAVVVCYVNSTAAVKAESDICCTSSNAVKVMQSIPADREIIFVPDRNLGGYAAGQSGRNLILHPGYCPTHQRLLPEMVEAVRREHPGASCMVHPECTAEVRGMADLVGSTAQIIEACRKRPEKEFIIGTENGILHALGKVRPDADFIPVSGIHGICPNMKKTSLELIAERRGRNQHEILIPEEIAQRPPWAHAGALGKDVWFVIPTLMKTLLEGFSYKKNAHTLNPSIHIAWKILLPAELFLLAVIIFNKKSFANSVVLRIYWV